MVEKKELGMYEKLIEWGLKSLTELVINQGQAESEKEARNFDRNTQILLEAIRQKNIIVQKRYDYSIELSHELVELHEKMLIRLSEFKTGCLVQEQNKIWSKQRLLKSSFIEDVHKPTYRALATVRNKFEVINELFSAYSVHTLDLLYQNNLLDNIEQYCGKRFSLQSLVDFYSNLHGYITGILITLIRITSNDMRFWLSEYSYFNIAEDFALEDKAAMMKSLGDGVDMTFQITLETEEGLKRFWDEYDKLSKKWIEPKYYVPNDE